MKTKRKRRWRMMEVGEEIGICDEYLMGSIEDGYWVPTRWPGMSVNRNMKGRYRTQRPLQRRS